MIIVLGLIAVLLIAVIPREHQPQWGAMKEHRLRVWLCILVIALPLPFVLKAIAPDLSQSQFFGAILVLSIVGQLAWFLFSVRRAKSLRTAPQTNL